MHGAMLHCPGGRSAWECVRGSGKIFADLCGPGNAQGRCFGTSGAWCDAPPSTPPRLRPPTARPLRRNPRVEKDRGWGDASGAAWGCGTHAGGVGRQTLTPHAAHAAASWPPRPPTGCASHLRGTSLRRRARLPRLRLRLRRRLRPRLPPPRHSPPPLLRLWVLTVGHKATQPHTHPQQAVQRCVSMRVRVPIHTHLPTPPPHPTPNAAPPRLASRPSQRRKKSNEPGFAASHSRP